MSRYAIRLCSDAYGIEKEYVYSKEEAVKKFLEWWDSAEKMIAEDERRELSYRLCIDIGDYDDEGYDLNK